MRLVRYGGAMSLDGYIAGPNGEADWIVMDPEMDFSALMNRFDTFLIGRKTFDAMRRMGNAATSSKGIQHIVFSRTLKPADFPRLRVESDAARVVAALREEPGKDIALFGGGIPVLPPPSQRAKLRLLDQRVYSKTGTIGLEYEILRS